MLKPLFKIKARECNNITIASFTEDVCISRVLKVSQLMHNSSDSVIGLVTIASYTALWLK